MPRFKLPAEFVRPDKPFDRNFVALEVGFDRDLQAGLKQFPGVSWGLAIGSSKHWHVPIELQQMAADVIEQHGYQRPEVLAAPARLRSVKNLPGLYPWQVEAVDKLLADESAMLMFAPGLGKTAPALCASIGEGLRVLWVCPAMTRWSIERECKRLYPTADIQVVIDEGEFGKADLAICSYNFIVGLESIPHFDVVVFDECHNIKNKKSQRSIAAKRLVRELLPGVRVFELSGTPVPNRPHDLWHPLDLMYPGRFGTEYQFQQRYSSIGHNGYGRIVGGLNPMNAEELQERLAAVAVRATEDDAAGLLPPLQLVVEWGKPEEFLRGLNDDEFLSSAADIKTRWASELLGNDMELGLKTAVVTWHRAVAEEIAKAHGVPVVHGETPPKQRDEKLTEIADHPTMPLVCTMASIAEGLNQLVAFKHVILAETYYRPASVVQALKRFHRLTSKSTVSVRVLVIPKTIDESILHSLIDKTQDINKLIKAGAIEGAVESVIINQNINSILEGWAIDG